MVLCHSSETQKQLGPKSVNQSAENSTNAPAQDSETRGKNYAQVPQGVNDEPVVDDGNNNHGPTEGNMLIDTEVNDSSQNAQSSDDSQKVQNCDDSKNLKGTVNFEYT